MPLPRDILAVLPEATAAAWPKVAAACPDGGYLAGGTAVAIHLRHRISRDLDVFVREPFDPDTVRRLLERAGNLVVTQHSSNTLNGVLDGARVQFLEARQVLLDIPQVRAGLPVAGIRDLLADKLKVVGDRDELRDYHDLQAIEELTPHRVEQGLAYYQRRYGVGPDDVTIAHIVGALGYLDDVADDPGLPVDRATVESYWRRRQPEIAAHLQSTSYTHGQHDDPDQR